MSDVTDVELLRARLNGETALIEWRELQRFFARGVALNVAEDLNLLDAATQMSIDNSSTVASWMKSGQLAPVNDQQAEDWLQSDATVWTVVVAPWVLVQRAP